MINIKVTRGKEFALQLKGIRQNYGWTQNELACQVGIPASVIAHYENGRRSPSLRNLVRLADALNVSVDLLLGRF